ncbi:pleckstrin homology domain-containing family A member 7-like isoform X3 [Hippocampus zosterae]|uniref:pleckstrin homology domain-containing family A member 7-like isoform X3 n=1 Tax=Hippocampus zosterae TaxID=109293 RepID=UPI00223D0398|nr:pleckstrin homology domain-containing family A member 7-like isoform X3 [Hippocampus zosterae]
MAASLCRDSLPEHWTYGVCRDGRVFFINDRTRETTWLHPRSAEPVNSGHMIRSDLPKGWEEGFTDEGASYFIDHNQRSTTFRHPVTGQVSPESIDFFLQEQLPGPRVMSQPGVEQLSSTTVSDVSTVTTSSAVDTAASSKGPRSGRVHSFGKREQAIKRNPNVPVVVRGWLYKQDSSGMRLWKRKWFVLSEFCLFYYKDSREEAVLGSIPLPSYVISPVGPEDHVSRKYAFKAGHPSGRSHCYKRSSMIGSQAEHTGMRTYYFSADTQEDMNTWLRAMNQAANMRGPVDTGDGRLSEQSAHFHMMRHQTDTHTNHVNNHKAPEPQRPAVHEVLLEPIHHQPDDRHGFHKDSPVATEMDTHTSLPANPMTAAVPPPDHASSSMPVSRVPSRAPSRSASTLPTGVGARNGLVETPSPILEPNGIAAGTYQRVPEAPLEMRRRSTLGQVEQWVKVQKSERKGPPSRDSTLPRRTPPCQPKFGTLDSHQTLPKTPRHSPPLARLGEYKYAQDRMSHFRLTPDLGGPGSNTVLQLYEWQQRQQYRHGSPTAPLYTPAPDYPFGARPPTALPPAAKHNGPPRCVSVPPSPADIPPPGPPPGTSRAFSPARRPHTPVGRVTVRPLADASTADTMFAISPRRTTSQVFKASTMDRRSLTPSNYMTHTVSAPSLHGKTPDELTLLLIQLRRQQAKMAAVRQHTLEQLQRHGLSTAGPLLSVGPAPTLTHLLGETQVDDTYKQLKQDLDYLDLKVAGSQTLKASGNPVKVAESDVDVKLSRLCEQDKILKDLEVRISSLKKDKDKLESVLDVSHQQMELFHEQPGHAHKIAYQQRLLQEDLVSIRAQISRLSTEMTHAWDEYGWLEDSVEQLRAALQARMNHNATPQQEKGEMKRELWRIEDVMAGLSGSKANYKVTIASVQNPERKLVPSVSEPSVPSSSADIHPPPRSSVPSVFSQTLPPNFVPKWAEDDAPPRPPLPRLYDYEETPPAVPPLPKEASAVIRHMSVRGLKRQSDERKRDREGGHNAFNGDCKTDLRSFLSEPELLAITQHNNDANYQYLDHKGLSGTSWQNQSSAISSFVTLRRGPDTAVDRERPKSALECLSSEYPSGAPPPQRVGQMSAEEQLERMKRHQRALVRERKRNLSRGERSSAPPPASVFDWREERPRAEGQSDEGHNEGGDVWLKAKATLVREADVEPLDYDFDISRELSKPKKVSIPERYVESDPEEPLSPEEEEERRLRTERIRKILTKSNVQNLQSASLDLSELESVLQEQEKIMKASRALASQASKKSKLVAAKAAAASP